MAESFISRSYSFEYNISSNASPLSISSTDFNITVPNGYTPMAIIRVMTGTANALLEAFDTSAISNNGSTSVITLRSMIANVSATARIIVLYAKQDLF